MITKQRYVEYLICTPINYTCFNLSEHLDHVSHDVVSNFLKQSRITARQVWELVKELINNTEDSFLIIDDSVQDKRYSKSIELVKTQYSGAAGGLARGIGVVNLVHSDGQEHYPVDYRIYHNAADGKTKPRTTISRTCSSTPLPTKDSRRKRCCSTVGMPPGKT
ncbi:MAG: transposase [Methylobacter sp.]